jgi:hypothetical protein
MHFVSQITLPPAKASRVTVTRVFQQPARERLSLIGGVTRAGINRPLADEPHPYDKTTQKSRSPGAGASSACDNTSGEEGYEVDTGALSEREIDRLMTRATEVYDLRIPIQEKIRMAYDLFARWGKRLRKDRRIETLLEQLEQDLEFSRRTMVDLDVVTACMHCDEEEGESCCAQGRGFEEKFDPYLLLMNLLLGVSLPERPARPPGCHFLTGTGCCLKVRLFLCVDFLCPAILSRLSHKALIRLQTVSGNELTAAFRAYDAIKRAIRENGSASDGSI